MLRKFLASFWMVYKNSFFRFIVVGVINTLTGSMLMFLLYNLAGTGYWLSSALSYILTSILSFFLNKNFTFGIQHWSAYMIIGFALTIAVSYLIAYGISKPAMNYFLRNSPQKSRENIALFAGMCLFTGLNYMGQRLFVFRRNEK